MTRIHRPGDMPTALAAQARATRDLQTAPQAGNSSISSGGTTVYQNGVAVGRMGHGDGRAGFLVPRGGSWVTVQEYAAADDAVLRGRIEGAEGRLAAAEGQISFLGEWRFILQERTDSLGEQTGALRSRMTAVEGLAAAAQAAASAAQSTANGRVTQAQLNAVIDYAVALTNAFNAHMDQYHGGNGKPNQPPPVKG